MGKDLDRNVEGTYVILGIFASGQVDVDGYYSEADLAEGVYKNVTWKGEVGRLLLKVEQAKGQASLHRVPRYLGDKDIRDMAV